MCKIASLNFSIGFNFVAPFMVYTSIEIPDADIQIFISYLREECVSPERQSPAEADTCDVYERDCHGNWGEFVWTQVTTESQADWLDQVVKQDG